jgi:hypothetical protein
MSTSTARTAWSEAHRRTAVAVFVACLGAIGLAGFLLPRVAPQVQEKYWGLGILHYHKFLSALPRDVQEELEWWDAQDDGDWRLSAPLLEPASGRLPFASKVVAAPTQPGSVVRYTLDGSLPSPTSPVWSDHLTVEGPLLVRARAFAPRSVPSRVVTRTYVTSLDSSIPVVSLAVDPVHLFDRAAGIIANPLLRGRVWQRLAVLSLLPAGEGVAWEGEVPIRVHGTYSRRAMRKRFRIYTSDRVSDVQAGLRQLTGPGSEASQTWVLHHPVVIQELYRLRLANRLGKELGLLVPGAMPSIVLVNGRPWGLYDLMPRVDARLIARREDTSGVTLRRGRLDRPDVVSGSAGDWEDLYRFIETNDLRDDTAYHRVATAIDLENLINFWLLIIFLAPMDYPQWNMEIYRDAEVDGRWRFLLYDTDLAFDAQDLGVEHDTLGWHLRDRPRPELRPLAGADPATRDSAESVRSTILFRRLMAHEDFQHRFRTRFEQELAESLAPERTLSLLEQILKEVEAFREMESAGYFISETAKMRDLQIARIREFLQLRPGVIRQLLVDHLGPVSKSDDLQAHE